MINNFPKDLHIFAEGNTYQFVRGYHLSLHQGGATLSGGPTAIELAKTDHPSYADIVAAAQVKCSASVLVCTYSKQYSNTRVRLPTGEELRFSDSGLLMKSAAGPIT